MPESPGEELSEYLEESDRAWEDEEKDPQLRQVRLRREALTVQLRRLTAVAIVYVLAVAVLLVPPWGTIDTAVATATRVWFVYLIGLLTLIAVIQVYFVVRAYRPYRAEVRRLQAARAAPPPPAAP